MTNRARKMQSQSGSGRSRKILWRSGSSLAAAAFLLASAPQAAQAQVQTPLRAPGMMVENAPHGNSIGIRRPETAQNQPHNRAPDFNVRNIRISAPLNPLPVNDVRISAPADLTVDNIRISAPITLSGANQPQADGMVAINQPQAIGPRINATRSFQANPVSASTIAQVAPNATADIVTLFGPETFINWTPLDTANNDDFINILPAGTSLTFVGPDSGYTVLNRVLPTGTTSSGDPRGIAFAGNVTGRLGASNGAIGGNIWFYSPGGIMIGAGATFDVGGLVLTTNDIDTTDGLFGAGGEIRFRGAADSIAAVTVESGATINALTNGSSYVAMVAPRVVQGGTVTVDGSAAYVAAEQADLTINNGLFDIAIGVGTTDANGVVHSGTTTGPSSTPTFDAFGNTTDADAQAIYMVAVPKNDALTMLVSGTVGYQAAASASVVNGNIVLSAGADVSTTGNVTNAGFAIDKTAAASDANIQLQNVAFGSSVSTFATNGIVAATASVTDFIIANNTSGTQDLLLEARNQIDINARGGGIIGANGNVTLRAGTDGVGGTININADQIGFTDSIVSGLIAIGDLVVDASATGRDDFFTVRNNGGTGIGQDAVGGEINVNISGAGDLVVGGTAQFVASAQGGKGESQNGSAQGGNINLNISSGTFNVTGTTFFDSRAIAAQNMKIGGNGPGLIGSDSIGGNVNLTLSGGAVTTGNILVDLGAVASSGDATGGVQSNDATSGAFDLTVTGGSHSVNDLTVNALADAGTGSFDATGADISGFARSGGANFLVDSGSLTVNADINSNFSTYGIAAADPADRIALTVQNGGTLTVTGSFIADTTAYNGIDNIVSTGGSISILSDNATIATGGFSLDSSAKPNDRFLFTDVDEGSDFQAGDISLIAQNGGTITSGFSDFTATATGNNVNAGNGTGGDIFIQANNGTINFTNAVAIDASGIGGVGGNKAIPSSLGIGQGGTISFRVEGAGGSLSFADLNIQSDGSIANNGEGTAPSFEGDGGFGMGGAVTFDLLGGTFSASDISIGSDGSGGGGGDVVTLPVSTTAPSAAALPTPADLTVVDAPFAGGTSAGDGGEGQGGDVTFNLNGGTATVANLSISANGFGGDGANGDINSGTAGGAGGSGIGGNAIFNAQSGSLTVTSTLTVSAQGNNQSLAPYGSRGAGGFGYGSDGGAGGAGIGGTATFNLDGTATITADQVVISTSAEGGYGGSTTAAFDALSTLVQAGIGGTGGNATGGAATFNNNAGTLNFTQLSVTSTGTGGSGGNVFGFSGDGINIAGDGGAGTGGTATININQDDLGNPVYVADASGFGGGGGDGLDGGNGGDAFGGTAAININGATAVLDDPTILANATGGTGGQGQLDGTTFTAGNSGDGGNATGGTARLEVTGAGGNIDLGFITLESDGTGGQGGYGYNNFSGNAGNGGNGGDGTGGRSELVTRTGGTINLTSATFDFTSTGTGGDGGDGGYTYAYTAGDGGDGGTGTGGTALFLAQGGTITGQDVNFTVAGNGGTGGIGGTYGYGGVNGVSGIGGSGTGGAATIEVQEGSPGIITLANVTMFANGYNAGDSVFLPTGFGGRIEITDTSTDPAGLISLGSLDARAQNAVGAITDGFFVTGNSGAIAILGNLDVDVAGNIEYALDGDGQMTVGGNANLVSGQNILLGHSNNSIPTPSITVAGTFNAIAGGDFNSGTGSQIIAGDTLDIQASGNVFAADLVAVDRLQIVANQNVTLGNGTLTGVPITPAPAPTVYPAINIIAGLDAFAVPTTFNSNFNATITGAVSSTGNINVDSGGSLTVQTGANIRADNRIQFRTGDDIFIQSGSAVTGAINPFVALNPSNPFTDQAIVILDAGGINGAQLINALLSPISSIVAAGDISASSSAVIMSANAIDGLGGTITASSLSADINDAPSNAVIAATGQSDDNGLLSAQCVEGNICLGTINANNLVYIGQASNNDVIQGIIESGTVSANDILVSTRRDIIMGTDGIATVLDATNQFLIQSTEGNIDLRDAAVSSASVQVSAASGSLLGSGSLTSANDIGITVGADINAALINAGGQLTTIANIGGGFEPSYTVPGSITVDTLTQGGGTNINIIAGGDIDFGTINLPINRSITLTAASGDAFLGSNSSATAISMLGNNVGFNDLLSTGTITLNATTGNLTGNGPGNLSANGAIDLDAAIDISFGNGTSASSFTANAGGNMAGNSLAAASGITLASGGDMVLANMNTTNGNIALDAQGAIDVDHAEAGGNFTATAQGNISTGLNSIITGGDIVINAAGLVDLGNSSAGGLIDVTGSQIDYVSLLAADSIALLVQITPSTTVGNGNITGSNTTATAGAIGATTASGSTILTGTTNAATTLTVNSSGNSSIANAISGGNSSITGASVTLSNGAIGGNLVLNATAGDVDGNGTVTVGGGIDLDATGTVGFGDLEAQGGTFTVDAGGNINFTSAASSDDMALNAGGGIDGGNLTSGGNLAVAALGGGFIGGVIVATGDVDSSATGDVSFTSIAGGDIVRLAADGKLVGGDVSAAKSGQGQVAIRADNGMDIGNVSGNDIYLTAKNGLVNVTNNVDVTNILVASGEAIAIVSQQDMAVSAEATNGDIALSSAAGLDVQGAQATGNIVIAAGGSATINEISNVGASAPIGFNSPQNAAVTGGDITISAADSVVINSMVNAADGLQITAGGLISIQADVVGSSIETVSSDMNIGSTGSLGQTDLTSNIQISADGTTQMVIGGGSDAAGAFSLNNDEFSRIHSGGDLTITVVPTSIGGFDMVVQDLNVFVADNASGPQSANIGMGNSLNLVSGQSISIVGLVDFSNANANSGLNFTAGQDLFIDAASGIIQMTDANGSYSGSGSLSIDAASVFAMTSQALDDIAGLGPADIDIRLASNDGIDLPDGMIRADNVQIAVSDNLLIQNTASGTDFADRRGFTVGSLSIEGPSAGSANIVINGIVGGATGLDTIPATDIAIGFDPASTINGCVINDPASCVPVLTPDIPEIDDPVQDVIEEEVTPEQYETDPFASYTIEIKENGELAEDPLIDEPVTGAGNDDLWVGGTVCERDDDGKCETDEEEKSPAPAE